MCLFSLLLDVPVDAVRSTLEQQSAFWFQLVTLAGYAVAFGCVLETPETFLTIKRWWLLKFRDEEREESKKSQQSWITPLAAAGLIVIVSGIVSETYFEGKVSDVESALRAHESDKITAAEHEATSAIRDAGTAKNSAVSAGNAAQRAREQSDEASHLSKNASTLAKGARLEADSFTKEIIAAKQQAADAVSRLADAEQRLADATQRETKAEAELSKIRTPRTLVHTERLVAALKAFKGTEFTLNVFMNDEAIGFTKSVALALKEAGWVRKQPTFINVGIPTLEIVFEQSTEYVPSCVDTGISVHAFAKEPLMILRSKPTSLLPKTVQAAISLATTVPGTISPPDERNVAVGILDPKPQEGVPMTICIGKKP